MTLEELKKLHEDWDGSGSPPITSKALAKAEASLRFAGLLTRAGIKIELDFHPVTGGGILFDWLGESPWNEVEILPSGKTVFTQAMENDSCRT